MFSSPRLRPHRLIRSRVVALLGLAGYLLAAVCAPGWHLHVADCGEECATAHELERRSQCHHACGATKHEHQSSPSESGDDHSPLHDEKDCFVCQLLAAKPLPVEPVTLAVLSEPVVEVLAPATPRFDTPAPAAARPRGPPQHA